MGSRHATYNHPENVFLKLHIAFSVCFCRCFYVPNLSLAPCMLSKNITQGPMGSTLGTMVMGSGQVLDFAELCTPLGELASQHRNILLHNLAQGSCCFQLIYTVLLDLQQPSSQR